MGARLYEAFDLTKDYGVDGNVVKALNRVSFAIEMGDFVVISGPSGSGKSTLLGLLGMLARPSSGSLKFCNQDVQAMAHSDLAHLRNRDIGFVFQSFQLLPRASAVENVELPLVYAGIRAAERRRLAEEVLGQVGLEQRVHHRPSQLSGGEQQRVAIARAVVNQPKVILADEPTGALDTKTGEEILSLLRRLNEQGTAIVVITHNEGLARSIENRMVLVDGRLVTRGHEH